MAVSRPREAQSAFQVMDPEIMHRFTDHRSVGQASTYFHDVCLSSYQPVAAFNRIPWDFGVYGVDPYYQALISYHTGRGFPLPPHFFPSTFKSLYVDEEKPNQSYIGLIGQAIMSSPEKKMVLSDIYKWVLTHYPYFRNKGPGWKNSVRHNLSLNDCFVKAGRSPNGKGNYWAINPENYEDFRKGDFRRRRAQRRSRKTGQSMSDDTPKSDLAMLTSEDETFVEKHSSPAKLDNSQLTPKDEGKVRTFDVENLLRVKTPE